METVLAKRRKSILTFQLSGTPGKLSGVVSKRPCYPKYETIEKRIESYKKWPIPGIQTPEKLAQAGFFYEGTEDRIRCFYCGDGLFDWRKNEDPSFEHVKYYPKCAFTIEQKGRDYVNKVRQTIKEQNSTKESRRATFHDFWVRSAPKTPEELAEAGFFYSGSGHTDQVQCFECDVEIENWKVYDVAWFKHAKRNPLCKFVAETKGSDFVNKVKHSVFSFRKQHAESRRNLDQPLSNEYKTIEKRISSFKNWPIPEINKPQDLAEVGLYYTGYEDYTCCFHCGGSHFSWTDSENPSEEHVRWYPSCTFIRQIKGEKFVEEVRKKFREKYATEESRKETFKNWPKTANKTPEELYIVGFFSTENEDQTQCFDCGVWHIDWEIFDDPWFIHAKLNPSCEFVNKIKGELFANKVEQALSFASSKKNKNRNLDSDECCDTYDDGIQTLMESPTIKTVLKIGFDECRIMQALRNHLKCHKEFKNVEELFAIVINSQKTDPDVSVCLRKLEEDNDRFKKTKICKICDKQGPIMLYVPCGHLHTCCFCVGEGLEHCVTCKEKVEYKLEMFPKPI